MNHRVLVAGALANKPGNGGEAWVRATWVLGLRRLGVDAWLVEELAGDRWGDRTAACIRWFEDTVRWFGIERCSVLLDAASGEPLSGPGLVDGGDLLVNISGHLRIRRLFDAVEHRAYVDLDPGYTQIWHDQGADLRVAEHHSHFTVGLAIGTEGCSIPTGGHTWHAIKPPVLLDEWTPLPGDDLDRLTTVAGWRGGFGTIEHEGTTYGPKAHELRRFVDLPSRTRVPLEIALDIHDADDADRRRLIEHGWRLVDPRQASGTPERFRDYVVTSTGELSVAQPIYVHTRTGWFSDRTAHYLAAGRPVIVQDTGGACTSGTGYATFRSPEEAASAIDDLPRRYPEHRAAARAYAETHLDASTVLARFLEQAGLA